MNAQISVITAIISAVKHPKTKQRSLSKERKQRAIEMVHKVRDEILSKERKPLPPLQTLSKINTKSPLLSSLLQTHTYYPTKHSHLTGSYPMKPRIISV